MRFFAIASVLFTAAVGAFASPLVQRDTPQSAASLLTDLSKTVTPLANKLLYATPENATQENLTPIIGEINTAVTDAVNNLKQLFGEPASVIMTSVDGTTTLGASDIAALLAPIVDLIFNATGAVLKVVDSTIQSIIFDLLVALGNIVFSLITVVISLVTGLLALLLPLLAPVLSIIDDLGLSSVLNGL